MDQLGEGRLLGRFCASTFGCYRDGLSTLWLPPGQVLPVQVGRRDGIGGLEEVGTDCGENRKCRNIVEGQQPREIRALK
jgi:hypothetical protein